MRHCFQKTLLPMVVVVVAWQEIYALGGYGSGRKQIMVINEFDPCCFSGTFANSFKEIVQNKVVNELQSGSWDYVLDSSSIVHAISSFAITEIIDPALSYFYDNIDKNQIPEPNSLSISSIGLFILIALLKGKTNKSLALNNYNVEFNIQTTYIKKIINVFLVRISHIINLYENI